MPKLRWPLQFCTSLVPSPLPAPLTMTKGPTGPKQVPRAVDGLSCLTSCTEISLGIFALGCFPWGPGVEGPWPRGEGGL